MVSGRCSCNAPSPECLETQQGSIQAGSRWGRTLAACDFDDDGRADLALGMLTPTSSGIVQVHPGSAAGLTPGPIEWKQGVNVPGTATAGDRFGDALACGDINHDGYADLAIATPFEDELSSGSVTDGGHIDVIYGSATGLDASNIKEWDRGDPVIGAAPAANDRWGTALAVGDFDKNGHVDLAVGMVPSTTDGEVDLLYGGIIPPTVPALPVGALVLLAGALGAAGARRAWTWTRKIV